MKRCFEENILLQTALSVDDIITVWYRGAVQSMVVVNLQSKRAGSLKDIDLGVNLDFV